MNDKPDFLTDAHKARFYLEKHRLILAVGIVLIVFLSSYLILEDFLGGLYLTPEEKAKYEEVMKLKEEFEKHYKELPRDIRIEGQAKINKMVERVEGFKPKPITIVTFIRAIDRKRWGFVACYLLWVFSIGGIGIASYLYLRKKGKDVIYQTASVEKVVSYDTKGKKEIGLNFLLKDVGKRIKWIKGVNAKQAFLEEKFFRGGKEGKREVVKVMKGGIKTKVYDEKRVKKAKKDILIILKKYEKEVLSEEEISNEEKVYELFILGFVLWHFVLNLWGNVPTGVLSIYIRDEVLRKVLALYQRRHLPITEVKERKSRVERGYKRKIDEGVVLKVDEILRRFYTFDENFVAKKTGTRGVFATLEQKYGVLSFSIREVLPFIKY